MILTPHALVGAAIVNLLPNHPIIGTSLALASHYALDMIPHAEYDLSGFIDTQSQTVQSVWKNTKAAFNLLKIGFDFFAAIFLCFLIFVRDEKTLMLTALGAGIAMLPDALQFFYFKFQKQPFVFFQRLHEFFHSDKKDKVMSFVLQFGIAFAFVGLYLFLK